MKFKLLPGIEIKNSIATQILSGMFSTAASTRASCSYHKVFLLANSTIYTIFMKLVMVHEIISYIYI